MIDIIEGNHVYPELGATVTIRRVFYELLEVTIYRQRFDASDLRKLASDLTKVAEILEE